MRKLANRISQRNLVRNSADDSGTARKIQPHPRIPTLTNKERDDFFRAAIAAGAKFRGPTIDEKADPEIFGIQYMLKAARQRRWPIWLAADGAICLGDEVPAWFANLIEAYAERVSWLMEGDFLGSWRRPPVPDDLPRVPGWGIVQ